MFKNINYLFTSQYLLRPLSLPNSTYSWYTCTSMEEVGDHWNQISNNDLITSLTPQEQDTIVINRFCIGITNHRF